MSGQQTWAAETSNISFAIEDAWWSGPDRSGVFQDFLDATSKKYPVPTFNNFCFTTSLFLHMQIITWHIII